MLAEMLAKGAMGLNGCEATRRRKSLARSADVRCCSSLEHREKPEWAWNTIVPCRCALELPAWLTGPRALSAIGMVAHNIRVRFALRIETGIAIQRIKCTLHIDKMPPTKAATNSEELLDVVKIFW